MNKPADLTRLSIDTLSVSLPLLPGWSWDRFLWQLAQSWHEWQVLAATLSSRLPASIPVTPHWFFCRGDIRASCWWASLPFCHHENTSRTAEELWPLSGSRPPGSDGKEICWRGRNFNWRVLAKDETASAVWETWYQADYIKSNARIQRMNHFIMTPAKMLRGVFLSS